MDEHLKQRLVGAAVLVLLAVIFIPIILARPSEPEVRVEHPTLPPSSETDFASRIVPLTEPKTPLVKAEPTPRPVPKTEPATPAAPAESPNTVTAAAKAPVTEQEPVPETAPPPETKKEAAPAPVPAPETPKAKSPSEGWAIQLGSFSSAENAVALRDRLKKMDYVAFIETARVEGKEITRVFVGPELSRERAEELVIKLQKDTELKGMVVQYPES